MAKYTSYTEDQKLALLKYYQSLSEKQRRHFLALQYKQLGFGSQRYLASVFSCSRITITKGCAELSQSENDSLDYSRQREPGGGRKKKAN